MTYKIPKRIGHYIIGEELKTKSCYPIHFAEKKGRKYVIKFSQTKELIQEYSLMRQLCHPNILPVIDFFKHQNLNACVMPIANGGDLYIFIFNLIENQTYIPETMIRILIRQILEALSYIHELGFVHRDVKPENIYFMEPNTLDICLADFGITRKLSEIGDDFAGTPIYESPEVLKQKSYPFKADCWAVGIIMFMLFYNRHPFQEPGTDQVDLNKMAKGEFNFDEYERSNEGKELITKLLCVDVKERISAKDALSDPWFNEYLDSMLVNCQRPSYVEAEINEAKRYAHNNDENNNNNDNNDNNNNDNDNNNNDNSNDNDDTNNFDNSFY